MPATITLTLKLTERPRIYPARLHGAVCALLEEPDADHKRQSKPFAAGPLRDAEDGTRWRLGWLNDAPPPQLPNTLRFGEVSCSVLGVQIDSVAYSALAQAKPAAHAQFETLSPLYFSRSGRDHPLPEPVLIMRGLAKRWNAHAPTECVISDEMLTALTDTVILHDMAGETVRTPVSVTMQQIGFLGTVRLGLTKAAGNATRTLFAALMRYATMAGIGAQTPHGFGAVELTELTA